MGKDKANLLSRWREKRQEKKVRRGPTPERLGEGRKRGDPTVRENAERAGGWPGGGGF
jgi:hypothetical protein